MDNDMWLRYARKLNFTDAQYEEAVKRIGIPHSSNQLLQILCDLSERRTNTAIEQQQQQEDSLTNQPVRGATDQSIESAASGLDAESTSSSSYYSSLVSSSSDGSCESMQPPKPGQLDNLKRIFIDGPNVARSHGKDAAFSWLGIKIAVDWFVSRKHKVKVFVPIDRCHLAEPPIVDHLIEIDALIKTPSGCNDDLFVIEAARQSDAIIVSNDLFRDEARFDAELQNFIRLHRLPYIFVDDLFIPARDPLGRAGPTLEVFLGERQPSFHNKLIRVKLHQRYNQRNETPAKQHRSLQGSKSVPIVPVNRPDGPHSFSIQSDNTRPNFYESNNNNYNQSDRARQAPRESTLEAKPDGNDNGGRRLPELRRQSIYRIRSHNGQ